jgi:diketogulonate reductase-like aldo/keto reductase
MVEMGYHHVDTAQHYGNEAVVGDGLAAEDVDREDVFLTSW